MEKNKYNQGKKLCEQIFQKTGDIRYHNMMKGFENLEKENELKSSLSEQEREF